MRRAALALVTAANLLAAAPRAQAPGPRPPPVPAGELYESSLEGLAFALRTGQVSSLELVEHALARIAAYDDGPPFLNGVLAVNPAARDEARRSDEQRARGLAHGPLFGIPVLVKDNIDLAGMPTTAGSPALAQSFPPDDAFLVQKLRAAGAIVLGKTTLTEFANFMTSGMPSGYCALAGYGLNPYDPRPAPGGDGQPVLTPGGSSSGSGIAVTASLVPVAVGTETSGSILSPASSNALVGVKPTLGLISRDGILPITADQDTPGPMARSVRDAAILLGVLAGFDPNDPATRLCQARGAVPGDYTRFLDKQALVGARIAVPRDPYWSFLAPRQRTRMSEAVVLLRSLGATVVNQNLPRQGQLSGIGIAVSYPPRPNDSSVLLYGMKHDLDAYLAGLGPTAPMPSLADIIAFHQATPGALVYGQSILLAAQRLDTSPGSRDSQRYAADRARDLALFRGSLDELFLGPDVLPGTGDEYDALLFPANFGADAPARAGYPSVTVPTEFLTPTASLPAPQPFGITFSGPALSEPRLLALAYAWEQATRFRRPPASTPPLRR